MWSVIDENGHYKVWGNQEDCRIKSVGLPDLLNFYLALKKLIPRFKIQAAAVRDNGIASQLAVCD